jgi:hypothetical protein
MAKKKVTNVQNIDGVDVKDDTVVTSKKQTIYHNFYTAISFSQSGVCEMYYVTVDNKSGKTSMEYAASVDRVWATFYADMFGIVFCY